MELCTFDPTFERFVFDPQDEAALRRCAREFNFHPEDFSYLHFERGELVVLDPPSHREVQLRVVGPSHEHASFTAIMDSFIALKEPTIAVIEAGVASTQGVQLRLVIAGRLFWVKPGSFILPVRFFEEPF